MWSDVARCDESLRILDTKFKVAIDINFLSKMGDKASPGVIIHDKMWQYVITFLGAWVLNLKLSLTLLFYPEVW